MKLIDFEESRNHVFQFIFFGVTQKQLDSNFYDDFQRIVHAPLVPLV